MLQLNNNMRFEKHSTKSFTTTRNVASQNEIDAAWRNIR